MTTTLSNAKIEIYLMSRRLRLFSGEKLIKEYPVAIGKPSTPTPTGHYSIRNKIMYPGGVYGTRWMEFKPRYGIHGTNNPPSIGTMASLGCVRMYNHDVNELFSKVKVGTPVHIYNATVGNPGNPTNPDSPMPSNPQQPNNPGNNSGSGQKTHIVQSGDTLWKLSKQYGTSISRLAEVNNLSDPNRLDVGQVLIIP